MKNLLFDNFPLDRASAQLEFTTSYKALLNKIDKFEVEKYAATRNFVGGAVSRLSPYISRGVISPKLILSRLNDRGINPLRITKFVQELAWREHWQRVLLNEGERVNSDLRRDQALVESRKMPAAVIRAQTGIHSIDSGIKELYTTGYMHNHVRMYVASVASNIARCHWKIPARWMYFHLLDGDWASNTLNWQWVAGTISSKRYFANQQNINRFTGTEQSGTFLDFGYEDIASQPVPKPLEKKELPVLDTDLPERKPIEFEFGIPTVLYNTYSLDPNFKAGITANRVLLLEPSHFKRFAVSETVLKFCLELAGNIEDIQVYVGEFEDFVSEFKPIEVHFKDHPLFDHYEGTPAQRDWIFDVEGYQKNFYGFWKQCERQLPRLSEEL